MPNRWRPALAGFSSLVFSAITVVSATIPGVTLVGGDAAAGPVRHGFTKLKNALVKRGIPLNDGVSLKTAEHPTVLVAGLSAGDGEAARLMAALGLPTLTEPESLLVRCVDRDDKRVVLAAGADERGLMYALLDIAERVGWSESTRQPFSEVRDTQAKPYVPERALSLYTFNRAYWESRFYDEAYWTRYFDLLALNRFNSLVVIFGYENGGFLAPAYTYFFDLEEFPEVRMVGISPEQQRRNLAALNRLIQMAHDRGLKFTVGIWDHIYRGGVQGGGIPGANEATARPVPDRVWGLTGENLMPYTKAALARVLELVPALDGVQFRMHDE